MRRGNREALLPPLRTLAAYPTQNFFISLDAYYSSLELPLFPPGLPLSEEKREKFRVKRGGLSLSGGKRENYKKNNGSVRRSTQVRFLGQPCLSTEIFSKFSVSSYNWNVIQIHSVE